MWSQFGMIIINFKISQRANRLFQKGRHILKHGSNTAHFYKINVSLHFHSHHSVVIYRARYWWHRPSMSFYYTHTYDSIYSRTPQLSEANTKKSFKISFNLKYELLDVMWKQGGAIGLSHRLSNQLILGSLSLVIKDYWVEYDSNSSE